MLWLTDSFTEDALVIISTEA